MNRKSDIRLAFSLMGSILTAGVMSVIVLIVFSAAMEKALGVALIQAINLLLLYFLIYMQMWRVGEKDVNYSNTGHITFDRYSGLKIGLYAMIVLHLPLVLLISGMVLENQLLIAIYRLVNAMFYGFHNLFMPVMAPDFTVVHVLLALFPPLFVPLFSSFAYYMGHKRQSIMGKIVYKKKK